MRPSTISQVAILVCQFQFGVIPSLIGVGETTTTGVVAAAASFRALSAVELGDGARCAATGLGMQLAMWAWSLDQAARDCGF
jgi:hypothetical protein